MANRHNIVTLELCYLYPVQTMEDIARQLRLTKFLQLCYEAGLLDKLQGSTEMTVFAPSDEAFNGED